MTLRDQINKKDCNNLPDEQIESEYKSNRALKKRCK